MTSSSNQMDPQGNHRGEHIPEVLSINMIFCWRAILFLMKVRPLAKLTPLCYKMFFYAHAIFSIPRTFCKEPLHSEEENANMAQLYSNSRILYEIVWVCRMLLTHPCPAKHKATSPRQYIWQVIWQRRVWLAPTLVWYVISLWHKHLENYYNFRRWMDWS